MIKPQRKSAKRNSYNQLEHTKFLGSYFYVIGISYDKSYYACSRVVFKWFQEQQNKWYCQRHEDYSSYRVERTKQKVSSIPISTPSIFDI